MIPYSRKRQWVKSRCLRWKKNSRASHGFHFSSHRSLVHELKWDGARSGRPTSTQAENRLLTVSPLFPLFFTDCNRFRINSYSNIHLHWPMVCDLLSTTLQAAHESSCLLDCNHMARITSLRRARVFESSYSYWSAEIRCQIVHPMQNRMDWGGGVGVLHYSCGVSLHVSWSHGTHMEIPLNSIYILLYPDYR